MITFPPYYVSDAFISFDNLSLPVAFFPNLKILSLIRIVFKLWLQISALFPIFKYTFSNVVTRIVHSTPDEQVQRYYSVGSFIFNLFPNNLQCEICLLHSCHTLAQHLHWIITVSQFIFLVRYRELKLINIRVNLRWGLCCSKIHYFTLPEVELCLLFDWPSILMRIQ